MRQFANCADSVARYGHIFAMSAVVRIPAIVWAASQRWLVSDTLQIIQPYVRLGARTVLVPQRMADVPASTTAIHRSHV